MLIEQVVPHHATFKNTGVTPRFFLFLVIISIAASSIVAQQPTLVSVNAAGTGSGNGDSNISDLCVSADGRFVVFASNAPDLVQGDTNGTWDVFVRDLRTGITTLVSMNAAGTGSGNDQSGVNGALSIPSYGISGDGRFVAFSSKATNLTAANDSNGLEDVFVRDLQTGTTVLATINEAGTATANGASIFPSIALDGSAVSFRSIANDLVANDTNGTTDVFVYRIATGLTSLVSVNAAGTGSGDGASLGNSVSDDGRYITFTSRAGNLVSNDSNGTSRFDVFLRDMQAGTTMLISVTPDGLGSGNADSHTLMFSADRSRIVFLSSATNLVALPDSNLSLDVFVRDVQAGITTLVSVNRQGTAAGVSSSSIPNRSISADGNLVPFISSAPDIVENDANGTSDVFVRNVTTGVTTLVSVNMAGTASGQLASGANTISISANGRFVTFESIASDLVPNDPDTVHDGTSQDVFVRDLQNETTKLVSISSSGISANDSSLSPIMSANGAVVVFASLASDLAANDSDHQPDVFAFTLATQLQFSSPTVTASESGSGLISITVTRTGDISNTSTVDYATTDGTASERSDYLTAIGTLRFAAGEASKTITVLIVNDAFGEGPETFTVDLSNPVGSSLGSPSTITVSINSDEVVDGPNPVRDASFSSDFFVRQHYVDFFNREADPAGLAFWKNQIDECTTQACREIRRINVSAAFYLSIEFQETGYLVYKAYQASFNTAEHLDLRDFLPDTQEIGRSVIVGQPGADQQLEANKQRFFLEFVQRPEFLAAGAFPTTLTAAQFVDKLNGNTLDPLNPGAGPALNQSQRDALVNQLAPDPTSATLRAQVLRSISENGTFHNRQFNKAFVLMQYFGYLRRNPNASPDTNFDGYNFWLGKLNQFNGNFVNAEMVKAFITSGEYIQRFGP